MVACEGGSCIVRRREAYISTLAVKDHHQPAVPRGTDRLIHDAASSNTMTFIAGGLDLNAGDMLRHSIKNSERERTHAFNRFSAARKPVLDGVEPDTDRRPAPLDSVEQAVGNTLGACRHGPGPLIAHVTLRRESCQGYPISPPPSRQLFSTFQAPVQSDTVETPLHVDLRKNSALHINWRDGQESVYRIDYLRNMSPSADTRHLREEIATNPLTVLPASTEGPVTATDAELVGNYAIRIRFSDGHDTGIFSWAYLRSIDPSAN